MTKNLISKPPWPHTKQESPNAWTAHCVASACSAALPGGGGTPSRPDLGGGWMGVPPGQLDGDTPPPISTGWGYPPGVWKDRQTRVKTLPSPFRRGSIKVFKLEIQDSQCPVLAVVDRFWHWKQRTTIAIFSTSLPSPCHHHLRSEPNKLVKKKARPSSIYSL